MDLSQKFEVSHRADMTSPTTDEGEQDIQKKNLKNPPLKPNK